MSDWEEEENNTPVFASSSMNNSFGKQRQYTYSNDEYKTKDYGRGSRGGRFRDNRNEVSSNYNNYGGDGGGGHSDRRSNKQYDTNRSSDKQYDSNRRSDWNDSNSNRFRNEREGDQMKDKMEIESNQVGSVIGRAGSNIKNIQSQYSVRINIDKNVNSNGTIDINISGDSQNNINDAMNHIANQLESNQYGNSSGNDYRSRDNTRQNDNKSYENSRSNNNYNFNNDYGSNSNVNAGGDNNGGDNYEPIDWAALNASAEEERRKKWALCPELKKDFYEEHPEVQNCPPEQVAKIRAENNKTVVQRLFLENDKDSKPVPNPVWKFEQCFSKYPDLLHEVTKQGFEKPSPIQSQAWPVLLKGEDLIGIAQTGTGKTLAFLLPALIHIEYQPVSRESRGGPNVLIMAPTRELALQIEKEVSKYSFRGIKSVCLYGGGSRREQINIVGKGVEIIIATPGRLNDLVQAKVIDVNTITYLVLDEADRMLDMGFEPQIRKILLDIRPDRQTIMTSATWPAGVRRLAQSYMNNPVQVCVGSLDLAATHTVTQVIEMVAEEEKYDKLLEFIDRMEPNDKAIVFCGKKARADDLSSELTLKGLSVQCIHGSREQSDREQAIADITSGEVKVLIATDVASRGLDIEDITYVVNYDFPRNNIEEYVHRVGRTGRAGRRGTSVSFITREDWASAKDLIKILEEADQEVPQELFEMEERFNAMKARKADELAKFGGGGRGGGGRRGGGYRRF